MTTPAEIVSAAVAIGTAIFGVYVWVGKHISNSKKHPCKDDMVFKEVCEERGKANDQAHEHLKEGIENAIKRSDEQHNELKVDMKAGFTKIEMLIRGDT